MEKSAPNMLAEGIVWMTWGSLVAAWVVSMRALGLVGSSALLVEIRDGVWLGALLLATVGLGITRLASRLAHDAAGMPTPPWWRSVIAVAAWFALGWASWWGFVLFEGAVLDVPYHPWLGAAGLTWLLVGVVGRPRLSARVWVIGTGATLLALALLLNHTMLNPLVHVDADTPLAQREVAEARALVANLAPLLVVPGLAALGRVTLARRRAREQ